MTEIYPYSILPEDATTEAVICWIDDRDGADGSSQILDWGDGSESTEGDEVPGSGGEAYRYEARPDGLNPDTEYSATIDGEVNVEWQTLPTSLEGESLDVVVFSDLHIDYLEEGFGDGSMVDEDDFGPVVDEAPDLVLFPGDLVTWGNEIDPSQADADNTEQWLRFWRDYWGQMVNSHGLVPICMVPGNHEVGNHRWGGREPTEEEEDDWDWHEPEPDTGFFQFFFSAFADMEPAGENYAQITVGDYLQVLALDTHSAYTVDVESWLSEGQIDHDVHHCIPMFHSPMLPGGERHPPDAELQERLREQWAPYLDDADNVRTTFVGHIHTRKRSVPWTIVDDEPDGNSFDIGDGYFTSSSVADGITEFGDGYAKTRDPDNEWFLDQASAEKQFYSLEITEESIEMEVVDENGQSYESHTLPPDVQAVIFGDVVLGDLTIGQS